MIEELIRRLRALEATVEQLDRVEVPAQVAVRYTTAVAQSLNSATTTRIQFDTIDDDPLGLVTTGASWVFTAPITGRYHIDARVTFAASTAWALGTKDARLSWVVGGALKSFLDWQDHKVAGTSMLMSIHGSDMAFLTAGQTIYVQARQLTGGALTLNGDALMNYIAIHLAG